MKLYNALYKDFEGLYVGYSALAIILSSCIGSIAAMLVLMNGHDVIQMVQLFLVVIVTMGYNTTVLAQLKPRVVFNALTLSILVSLVLIVINLVARY